MSLGNFLRRVVRKHGATLLGPSGAFVEDEKRSLQREQREADREQLESARNAERQARIDARKELLDKQRKRRGFSSTILTGGLGLTSPARVSRKTLLGQ